MTDTKGWTISLKDVELVPERTIGTPPISEHLAHRLSFGQDLLPVTEPYAPPEWCAYAAGLAHDRAFRLLVLVRSFHPEQPESPWIMAKGKLGLALSTEGETSAAAVARRIDPGERTRPVNSTPSTISFSFNAGLFSAGMEHPVGPEFDSWWACGAGWRRICAGGRREAAPKPLEGVGKRIGESIALIWSVAR